MKTGPPKYSVIYLSCSLAISSPYSGVNSHLTGAFFKISITSLWSILVNLLVTNFSSFSLSPLETNLSRNSTSSRQLVKI